MKNGYKNLKQGFLEQFVDKEKSNLIMSELAKQKKTILKAQWSSDKQWWREFYNNFSVKDKGQDVNLNHLKKRYAILILKDQMITTNFETCNDGFVINKTYLDTSISKIKDHLSVMEKQYICSATDSLWKSS